VLKKVISLFLSATASITIVGGSLGYVQYYIKEKSKSELTSKISYSYHSPKEEFVNTSLIFTGACVVVFILIVNVFLHKQKINLLKKCVISAGISASVMLFILLGTFGIKAINIRLVLGFFSYCLHGILVALVFTFFSKLSDYLYNKLSFAKPHG
jgi:uncharacterized membrane protein YpjA